MCAYKTVKIKEQTYDKIAKLGNLSDSFDSVINRLQAQAHCQTVGCDAPATRQVQVHAGKIGEISIETCDKHESLFAAARDLTTNPKVIRTPSMSKITHVPLDVKKV